MKPTNSDYKTNLEALDLPMRSQLRESYVGAIVVALLLSAALNALIRVIEAPVASVVMQLINFLGQRSFPDSDRLRMPDIPPLSFNLLRIATASSLFLLGCLLAFWLYPRFEEPKD